VSWCHLSFLRDAPALVRAAVRDIRGGYPEG